MASALGSELSCPICLELFDDPVTLPCMHSYCRKCLESILLSSGGKQIQCPECRKIASLDEAGLQKLPRNFTLANIVAKYQAVDKISQIPCDLCDEKMQQNAVKSCRECRLSYCMQCLILHPQRGALAKHSLVEPKEFVSIKKEMVCLTCSSQLAGKDYKPEKCQRDAKHEVVDVETAKIMLSSKMQQDYVVLDERRRKYVQDIYITTEALDDIMKKSDVARMELLLKCQNKTEEIVADFKQFQETRMKEVKDKGQRYLLQLKEASNHLHDILPDMKKMLEKAEKDVDFKDLQGLYSRVQKKVEEKDLPECKLICPSFDVDEQVIKMFSEESKSDVGATSSNTNLVKSKEDIPQVTIKSCTRNPRKHSEGASVTVTWDLQQLHRKRKFELKFEEIPDKQPSEHQLITVRNFVPSSSIENPSYTANNLVHNVRYSITVSVQDKAESESETAIVHTLPAVNCEPFLMSSVLKSEDIRLDLTNKFLNCDPGQPDNINSLCKVEGLAAGTTFLFTDSLYWEAELSYHLRGINKLTIASCIGICAEEKLDGVRNIVQNHFFYGMAVGKDFNGQSVVLIFAESKCHGKLFVKGERNYLKKFGFFYNAREHSLVIVNVNENSIILKTKQLKTIRDEKCKYCPIFSAIGKNSTIKIFTGSDITTLPTCLLEHLA